MSGVSTNSTTAKPQSNSYASGITASTTQTQGQQPLTSTINQISTCVNDNDTVTLPSAVVGDACIVQNDGGETLQIFPASGETLGQGINAAMTLSTLKTATYYCHVNGTWFEQSPDISGAAAKDWMLISRTTSNDSVAVDTRIEFNNIVHQAAGLSRISLDTTTNIGRITLTGGFDYRVQTGIRIGDAGNDLAEYKWYDVDGTAEVSTAVRGAGDCNWATTGDQPNAIMFVSPASDNDYELHGHAIVNSPVVAADWSWCLIEEI